MADSSTTSTAGWVVPAKPTGFTNVPYSMSYGGQGAPYADISAQILDTMRQSGLMGPSPVNPLMGNTAGRYSFGGGGGYGGVNGLLGRGQYAPGAGGPPGMNGPGGPPTGGFNPQNPPPNPGISQPNPGITGGQPPLGQGTGSPQFANQAQGFGKPSGYTPNQQQLAELAYAGGGQGPLQSLLASFGGAGQGGYAPTGMSQLINSVGAGGANANPLRNSAIAQMIQGKTPQQVINNPMNGAAGGNYYNLDGTPTGANKAAATQADPSQATSLQYLQQIYGLLGHG